MSEFSSDDIRFMRRALALARRGIGAVEPNPLVGAVVARGGSLVAEGYHRRYGGAHAEVEALRAAGVRARGATLYVTLEPCSHHGKTPPCAPAVAAAGVVRVVAAMVDPFPRVRGRGLAYLRKHGIRVEAGLLEAEARALNAAFITRITRQRPYIIAKWAQSVDGRIAAASGESKWISGEASRQRVQTLRGRVDGVVVGIGTVLADDPLLMARPARGRDIKRIATRIILDTECRLPATCQLVRTLAFAPVMVVHGARLGAAAERRRKKLAAKGVMTHAAGAARGGVDLAGLFRHLGTLEYANVLVEGGGTVLGSLFRAGLVDEAQVFVAPLVIGGERARHAVGGPDIAGLKEAHRLRLVESSRCGVDVHLVYRREG